MTSEGADPNTPDLTPRTVAARRQRSRWPMLVVLFLIAGLVVGLLWYLISNTSSFQEAPDAVAKREQQGAERFQLLGSPLESTVAVQLDGSEATAFTVAFDGVKVDVVNLGTPAAQFQEGVPVVLEGYWVQGQAPIGEFPGGANDGWYFRSDNMLVKHDNDYREDRIDDAEQRGQTEEQAGEDS